MGTYEHGYEVNRFENSISQNFHCPICLKVLKEPVMCQRNQHCFCRPCITRHLKNSPTCPSCKERLTSRTLSQAPRILTDYLSELNIRCNYFSRGCREVVQLKHLENHVKNCGFAPVKCSNKRCLTKINKRDRTYHETEVCEFRKVKCHDCTELRWETGRLKRKLTAARDQLDEMKEDLQDMKDQLGQLVTLPNKIHSILNVQQEMMKEVRGMITELKDEIKGVKEAVQRPPTVTIADHVVIAGGRNWSDGSLNSVEMFSLSKKTWSLLQPMKEPREGASSDIYNGQIIITGGRNNRIFSDTMEGMNMNEQPSKWYDFPTKLPIKCYGHKSVVICDKRLIMVGGATDNGERYLHSASDSIYEISLVPPFTAKLLTKLPRTRYDHGVEFFNDKILIFGGMTCGSTMGFSHISTSSVFMYDINKNECREMAQLPYGVHQMGSVRWGDNVVVIGGAGASGKPLNNVFIYNIRTGKHCMLPPMKYKRRGCTAVISSNVIVVMGGTAKSCLNSVECFSFDRYFWEELPPMNEAREGATGIAW